MPTNTFLEPGAATPLTFLFDTPKTGESKFGPFRAYRVKTPDGAEHTFFPPRSLFPDIDRLGIRRGTTVAFRLSERISSDGRVVPKVEIDGVVSTRPSPIASPTASAQNSIQACVALKAAVSARGTLALPEEILATAEVFLGWLKAQ